jgi:DNA-directed RNA polymerase beta subunit
VGKSGVSYESLDAHGLPRIGSRIHPGVALIGKVSSVVDSVRGGAVEEDASLIGDLVTHGVVDKVVNSSPKTNGMRVKIRLREESRPSAINFPVVTARKVLSVAW